MSLETVASEVRLALGKQKPAFRRAALFSVVIGCLMLAPSFYMLEVYDRVLNSRNMTTLVMLTLLLALVYVVLEVAQWVRQGVLRQAAEGFDVALGGRVYEAVFLANLHGARAMGQRSLRDFATVRDFVCSPVMAGLMDIPMALLLVGVIFYIDQVLGWFGLASALIQGVITFFNKRSAQGPLAKANTLSNRGRAFVESSLKNGEAVRAMGMSEGLRQRWLAMQKELLSQQALASDRAGVFTALSKYVQLVSSSLMLGLGAWLLLGGNFAGTEGLILMASILAGRALAPLVQVITGWRNVVNAREALARLEELLKKVPAIVPGLSLPAPRGRLTLEHVTARPPGMGAAIKPVLRNVSLELPPGKMLVVVGPSASGKSSLTHLLVGTWPCLGGTVRLDGVDVFTWNKLELGPHVGFLPQEVALFEGTIAQNIARFGELDYGRIETAARTTGLHDYILDLPQRYDTAVGDDGVALSGGMRQRVGLARAIYGSPRLVVLDEPDANLDENGDAALANALQTLRADGATVVAVTHRKDLLAMADLMLLLVDGDPKAFGPPAAVLNALRSSKREDVRKLSYSSVMTLAPRGGGAPMGMV
ncbi:MAG: type I secretion system permease/ATPase [Azoarcus sp.]|jgi:ATP-binding cassette subfamily C exporter for protease/lipase|nr:type I secretion system permease/ATPase [Azoarcus sp.]